MKGMVARVGSSEPKLVAYRIFAIGPLLLPKRGSCRRRNSTTLQALCPGIQSGHDGDHDAGPPGVTMPPGVAAAGSPPDPRPRRLAAAGWTKLWHRPHHLGRRPLADVAVLPTLFTSTVSGRRAVASRARSTVCRSRAPLQVSRQVKRLREELVG